MKCNVLSFSCHTKYRLDTEVEVSQENRYRAKRLTEIPTQRCLIADLDLVL